jgi:hypothetical protein
MTRYAPLWQQGGSYAASVDRGLFSTLWPSGGVSGGAVTAVANTMTVSVAPGTVAVVLQAGQGVALCRWDAAEVPPALAAAPPAGQSRIDVVVAQVRDNALDAGGNNDFVFNVVTGTPAATGSQTVPATPTNAYAMANVLVGPSIANLNTATITDRRGALAVAGTLLAVNRAAPASQGSYTFGGGATAMPDMAVTFVAPLSGRVLVRWSAYCVPSSNAVFMTAMYSAGAQIGAQNVLMQSAASAVGTRYTFSDVISGLTPGQSYTFTPYGYSGGGQVTYVYYGGPGTLGNTTNNAGPAVTEVFAA